MMARARGAVAQWGHRNRKMILVAAVVAALLAINLPPAWTLATGMWHDHEIHTPAYLAEHGRWDVLELPSDIRVNAIHAAVLPTGKVLIVAGSGNDRAQFDSGTFKTLVYDPVTGQGHLVPTPADLFCGGHAFLPDGKLLVAGGTKRYELLDGAVTHAAGAMTVKNEFPDGAARTFPRGTEFIAPGGQRYRAASDFTLAPASKVVAPAGPPVVTASQTRVWVEAEEPGPAGVTAQRGQYAVAGLEGPDLRNIYGLAEKMTLDKQDYQGLPDSYEFDPVTETYRRVGDMHEARWYPTLTGLTNGQVLAVSGLDDVGQIVDGQNETYDPNAKVWTERPDLKRYFPTYPALFQTGGPDTLFYSGANSGYGPAEAGRVPGLWNLATNQFTPVPGMRDPDLLETAGSGWVGTVQRQKVMVVGGGGVGESSRSTGRIDTVDLSAPNPHYVPGPSLPEGTRYPNLVTLPDDTTLITGGSSDYRGKSGTDNHTSRIYHPDNDTLSVAADPTVGRNYHSEALLLPGGQVLTLGSDALFGDPKNLTPATFEQRIEIYSPPYLFQGARPTVTGGPDSLARGASADFSTPDAANIATARLIRPAAATHVTNLEQRSIALDIVRKDGAVSVRVPPEQSLVPAGFYMLFMTDTHGVPSVARWVRVP